MTRVYSRIFKPHMLAVVNSFVAGFRGSVATRNQHNLRGRGCKNSTSTTWTASVGQLFTMIINLPKRTDQ